MEWEIFSIKGSYFFFGKFLCLKEKDFSLQEDLCIKGNSIYVKQESLARIRDGFPCRFKLHVISINRTL